MKQCERSPALLLNEKRGICPYQIRSRRRSVHTSPQKNSDPLKKNKLHTLIFAHLPEKTDFSSLFNWNTKQVFVWIQATWPASPSSSPSTPPSQAVIWDTIINSHSQLHPISPERIYTFFTEAHPKKKPVKKTKADDSKIGVIRLRNSKPKYQITSFNGRLASTGNVTLEVGWNVQPWVGALLWTQHKSFGRWTGIKGGRSKAFDFPALKGKAAAKEPVLGSPEKPKPAEAKAVI